MTVVLTSAQMRVTVATRSLEVQLAHHLTAARGYSKKKLIKNNSKKWRNAFNMSRKWYQDMCLSKRPEKAFYKKLNIKNLCDTNTILPLPYPFTTIFPRDYYIQWLYVCSVYSYTSLLGKASSNMNWRLHPPCCVS